MEITVYALFSIFCYLVYLIVHQMDFREEAVDKILTRLFLGIIFIVLGIMTLKLEYIFSNGQYLSHETVVEDAITNTWQYGLTIIYLLTGFLQIIFATMDGLRYRAEKKQAEVEE